MLEKLKSEKKIRNLEWKEFPSLFKETVKEYFKESTLMHSASLAYYTLFAIVPLIYLALNFFGRIVGNEVVVTIIADLLKNQVGISDISGIMEFLKTLNLDEGNLVMEIVGVGALLFSCSAFLFSLKRSINDFFNISPPSLARKKMFLNGMIFRLVSIAIIACFGVIIIAVYIGETILVSFGKDFIENETLKYFYSNFLEHFASIFMSFVIFSVIFKYVHDGAVKWKLAMAGAFVTAVLLYIGQLLIKYYLNNYFFAAKGGFAGTIFVLLAWVYYSAQIIFFGAKFTAVYAEKVGQPIRIKFKTEEELEKSIL